jgi:hypothetical protein
MERVTVPESVWNYKTRSFMEAPGTEAVDGIGGHFSMLQRKQNERGLPRNNQCPKMVNVGPIYF